MERINIARDFSDCPGPRYKKQGPHSGQQFRAEWLVPAFVRAQRGDTKVVVELDGVKYGYPTSFLEEAFGGLARKLGIMAVEERLVLESASEPMLVQEILRYIKRSTGQATGV